MSQLIKI